MHTVKAGSKGWTIGTTAIVRGFQMKLQDAMSLNSLRKEPIKEKGGVIGNERLEAVSPVV